MITGVFGGSFDPPHAGHASLARIARDAAFLDRVLMVPSGDHPFKRASSTNRFLRLEMCRLACLSNPLFTLCDVETRTEGVTYTVDTMEMLAVMYPQDEFYFLCGSDLISDFPKWRDFSRLARKTGFVIIPRSETPLNSILNASLETSRTWGARIIVPQERPADVSSTLIRQDPDAMRHMLDANVYAFIKANGLYAGTTRSGPE